MYFNLFTIGLKVVKEQSLLIHVCLFNPKAYLFSLFCMQNHILNLPCLNYEWEKHTRMGILMIRNSTCLSQILKG